MTTDRKHMHRPSTNTTTTSTPANTATTTVRKADDYTYNSGLRRVTNTPVLCEDLNHHANSTDTNTMMTTARVGRGRSPHRTRTRPT
ncbi:hypothetical protein BDZ89DRAFT_1060742 [Hymenopellis radicata]|nr:hypothetical protein BDZ89DRAFT_1060742 [Hymenopellis radicata]